MTPCTHLTRCAVAFAAIIAITAGVYAASLNGPFLLDDESTFLPIKMWLLGAQGWELTLAPSSSSLLLSRPVSMGSFMLSAWFGGGVESFPFKLGNLIIHVLCGVAGWWLLRRLLKLDPNTSERADAWALAAAAFWMLHPMHVSTVLYAVQRMAQLATLFTLLAVIAYLVGRIQLEAGRRQAALANLFVAFPALLLLGMFSKQNAAIAGFICLAIELAYFSRPSTACRPISFFFGLFAALPAVAGIAILVVAPARLLGGYADWDFTLGERLLTQPRALIDYIGMWFVPRGPEMGLYTDAYPISQSLLSPASTLPAILAILGASIAAIAFRKRWPMVFAGWFFFLAAHAVESSFLPLEMYYEHRNYLPSLGLLLAAIGVIDAVARCAGQSDILGQRLAAPLIVIIAATLSFSTFARTKTWESEDSILQAATSLTPMSPRAHADATLWALRSDDVPMARSIANQMADEQGGKTRRTGMLLLVLVDCVDARPQHRDRLISATRIESHVGLEELHLIRSLEAATRRGECAGISTTDIAEAFVSLLDGRDNSSTSASQYLIRLYAARLHARAGDWSSAREHSRLVWDHHRYLPAATLLARSELKLGNLSSASAVLEEISAMDTKSDPYLHALVDDLSSLIRERRSAEVGAH